MAITDVPAEAVLVDDFADVAQDLGSGRDGRAGPRLEAIAKGVEIAVGTYAGISVGEPGAAKAFLRFEDDKARPRALHCQVIGCADAGDACPDDQDVEILDLRWCGSAERCRIIHRSALACRQAP